MPRICDYEGSKYRVEFWENQNRTYEDAVERIAMRKLLPPRGERLIEIGAGFGRLVDLYQGYKQIVLTDYARTQLEEAQTYLGQDDRIIYVVADVYNLPFVNNVFDALTMVRVMHHLTDVPVALSELHRVITPNGTAVIEHASKFHLKSIARWLMKKQNWSPFEPEPVEFVDLNFNFHPAWMRRQFKSAGLRVKNTCSLSHYRVGALKKLVPTSLLVKMDGWAQVSGNWWQLTPSLFLQAQAEKPEQPAASTSANFFRCPRCKSFEFPLAKDAALQEKILVCNTCQQGWLFRNGIYDFKNPVSLS